MSKNEMEKKLNRLLNVIKPPDKKKNKDYKSYSLIRKMDGSYSIKLMFGYNNEKSENGKRNTNPIYGESYEFKGVEFMVEILSVLEYGLVKEYKNQLFNFDEIEHNPEWD